MIIPSLLKGKNVLLRTDLDVPVEGGRVVNDYRLQALLPTLRLCLVNAQSTLLIGHLGRPGSPSELVERGAESGMSLSNDVSIPKSTQFGLEPVREWLENALHQAIYFINSGFSPGEWARGEFPLAMFDNLRFHPGELEVDRAFAKQLTVGSDIYVYEAFAAYNSATSLQIIPELLPTYPGLQFDKEVGELTKIIKDSATPSLLIISGAKDDKKKYVENLAAKFDKILIGGRLVSSFHGQTNPKIVVADLTEDTFDINAASIARFVVEIQSAQTIVLNGPLGRFEDGAHIQGTKRILEAVKLSPAYSVIGGGDTLAAIPALGFSYTDFDFVSTGGGAMLEFLATGTHPLLEIIKQYPHVSPS